MNATPPEAKSEYSRGSRVSEGPSSGRGGPSGPARSGIPARLAGGLFALGLLGALLLLVAEFTTLFDEHEAGLSQPLRSVTGGSHHSYAMALIAACAVVLAIAVWRAGSRPALAGLGILGVAALLIALLGDLSDATASGLIRSSGHYINATTTPSAGFYMETLGAVVLIVTSVCGWLLIGPAPRARRGQGEGGASDPGRPVCPGPGGPLRPRSRACLARVFGPPTGRTSVL